DHTGEPLDELPNREDYRKVFERPPAILVHMNQKTVDEFVEGYRSDPYFSKRYEEAPDASGEWTPGRRYFKDELGLLYFLDADFLPRLCVPTTKKIRVLQEAHESPLESAHG
ncbi:hypothetical protein K523DRAFT_199432, partial [Schizophyllum commune Tattone D]